MVARRCTYEFQLCKRNNGGLAMKKWTFQKGLFVILVIIILLSTFDRYTGRNFFDVFFCLFLFVIGINIGLNLELE